MTRIPSKMCLALALLAACSGGSGLPDSPTGAPVLVATPGDGTTLAGSFTVSVTATGNYVDISTLTFTEPAAFTGAKATFDGVEHTATVAFDGDTSDFPNGALVVRAKAVDVTGKSAEASWTFVVSAPETKVALDGSFASFSDEAGATPSLSSGGLPLVPARYAYAAGPVAVTTSAPIHKIATRLRWSGATPTAAQLEAATDTAEVPNLPVMRFTVPHADGAPAITSATATVTLGAGSPVTVALTPASASPAGAQAYLLPLAANLFPDLGGALPAEATLAISVRAADALDHVAAGGPWVVKLVPLPPPLVVKADTGYAQAADPLSAYPYKVANPTTNTYATLWGSGFAAEGGVRVLHFTVANPDPATSVALGAAAGSGAAWSLAESWPNNQASISTWRTYTYSCSPSTYGCQCSSSGVSTSCDGVYLRDVGASSFGGCTSASYGNGPATQNLSRSGALGFTAYRSGSAAQRSGSRFVVPPASASAPGILDLYVIRPVPDRTGLLPLTWVSARSWYEGGTSYATRQLTNSSHTTNQSCPVDSTTWSEIQWDWRLASASETVTGTAALDARLYGTSEYGATAAVGSVPVSASITH